MASFLLKATLATALSASHVLASCSYGTFLQPRAEEGGAVPVNTFGYTGAQGPLNWVALDPAANAACATGTNQSPIDMVDGVFQMVEASDLTLSIPDIEETEFENLGTTVEVIGKGGSLVISNITYEFKQTHWHLPSEHLDNGTSIAMEQHMVFQSADNQIAVIGIFVDLDNGGVAAAPPAAAPAPEAPAATETSSAAAEAPAATETTATAPAAERLRFRKRGGHARRQEPVAAPGSFGGVQGFITTPMAAAPGVASNVLETVFAKVGEIATPGTSVKTGPLAMTEIVNTVLTGSFQSYAGSLTTPPCSEGVRWLVATQKLQIQTSTFEQVRSVIGFNSRFPQNKPGEPNVIQLAMGSAAQIPAAA
ncbi:alpha carbonic anhydrase [Coniochaeta sp. 2T2.1]|nr:alpha carbonic anhydrase [Coniochaeta sp. 2T2.1]